MADKRAWFFNVLESFEAGFSEAVSGTASLARLLVNASPSLSTFVFLFVCGVVLLFAYSTLLLLIRARLGDARNVMLRFDTVTHQQTKENIVWLPESYGRGLKKKTFLAHLTIDDKPTDSFRVIIHPKRTGISKSQAIVAKKIYDAKIKTSDAGKKIEFILEKEIVDLNELFIRKAVLAAFAMALVGGVIDLVINEYYYQKSVYEQAQ